MRLNHHSSPSNEKIEGCTTDSGTACDSTTRNSLKLTCAHSIHACIFNSISSPFSCGGVLYLHSTAKSDSTSLTVDNCIFNRCSATGNSNDAFGGGAIYLDCGSLYITSTIFNECSSLKYGGGIYAYNNCKSSSISHCSFINCGGGCGGGLMTWQGPTSSVTYSRFIFCRAGWSGGGLYHDCNTRAGFLSLSDTLFTNNRAYYQPEPVFQIRGGGAFEDFRSNSYSSTYSFSFFTGNLAPSGVGNDISIYQCTLNSNMITVCFTTTFFHSFYNTKDQGHISWLHLTLINSPNHDHRLYHEIMELLFYFPA